MNNGKVRIYELSKELNLDNRDILTVCEQLNIAVKSHSSTITEDDATRIRSAAATYTPRPSTKSGSSNGGRSRASKSSKGSPTKKPQILEVRRRPAEEGNGHPELAQPPVPRPTSPSAPASADSVPTPPRAPSKPAAPEPPTRPEPVNEEPASPVDELEMPALVKPVSRPVDQVVDQVKDQATPPAAKEPDPTPEVEALNAPPTPLSPTPPAPTPPDSNGSAAAAPKSADQGSEESVAIAPPESPESQVSEPEPEPPKLIKPPPRPAAQKPEAPTPPAKPSSKSSTPKPGKPDKPSKPGKVAKSEKQEKADKPVIVGKPKRDTGDSKKTAARRGDRPSPEIVKVNARSISEDSAPVDAPEEAAAQLLPKPKPELRRPKPRPGAGDTDDKAKDDSDTTTTVGDTDTVDPLLDVEKPRRPPVRPSKRKTRQRDDDDEQDLTPKSKAAAKVKRRSQLIDDDDDEFDIDGNGSSDSATAAQVSLSLMRPPKPKSQKGGSQAKPSTPPAPQRKKPNTSKDSSSSSRGSKRDRREQAAKQERPELLVLTESITVHDLADRMAVSETEIIKALFLKGIQANINQLLDIPTASMVAEEFEVVVETGEKDAEARKVTEMLDADDLENLQQRPPVVTIMGHVDHGKTTLLDSIRKTKVAQGEAGGITQHIGAYHVDVDKEDGVQQVVFLDTPGHEAFTAMRARGARVTDIAVLVVAADDGVRPQTIEAISHAQAAEVPIVVAINKIDKEEAQPDRVKQELTEYGLVPEEWGGETIMVPVSAIQGDNLDTLLEMLLLVSEVEDLYANPDRPAKGTVIEANLDKARGPVATLLIQNGTLRVGDTLVAGSAFCKVRAMIDDRGQRVTEAYPSFAVEVLGLSDVPAAGDEFEVLDEKEARSLASDRSDQQRQSRLQQAMASRRVSLNTLSAQAQEGELKELNLVLKADVQGSVEAILGSLQQLPQKEVQVRVLLAAPGEISETDVDLAAASDAVIIGFNTTLATGARHAADDAGVDIRDYSVIYKLLEDIQGAMEGLLDPELVEEPLGRVEVRAIFTVGKGAVAGCYVLSGKANRNCKIRVHRGEEVVFQGNLDSLKRMKDDVKEVNAGYECGIGIDNFNQWQEGDIIETFKLVTKRRTLSE